MEKKVQKDINKSENDFLQSFDMTMEKDVEKREMFQENFSTFCSIIKFTKTKRHYN